MIGKPKGWTLTLGGNVGAEPRIGEEIAADLAAPQAIEAVEKVIQCYKENSKKGERMGKMIERTGIDLFKEVLSSFTSPA